MKFDLFSKKKKEGGPGSGRKKGSGSGSSSSDYKALHKRAYDALSKNNIHWGRKDNNTIYTSHTGYNPHTGDLEPFMQKHGFTRTGSDFDKVSGTTRYIYKHK